MKRNGKAVFIRLKYESWFDKKTIEEKQQKKNNKIAYLRLIFKV